jgi:Protein of unknown function (DUF3078)
MKIISTILISAVISSAAMAQDAIPDSLKQWKKGGVAKIGFNSTALTNWAAGGNNTNALSTLVSLFADYKKDLNNWNTKLDLAYGLLQNQDNSKPAKLREKFIKNDDRIQLLSKYSRDAFKNWKYAAFAEARTQFANGYKDPYKDPKTDTANNNLTSTFLSPLYGEIGLGMDYAKTMPTSKFSVLIAPIGAKLTHVGISVLRPIYYSENLNKPMRWELGAFLKAGFSKDFTKELNFKTNLGLFTNYLKNPQNVDVNWETLTSLQVGKYINVAYNSLLIYDDDVTLTKKDNVTGPGVQYRGILSIGFTYKF